MKKLLIIAVLLFSQSKYVHADSAREPLTDVSFALDSSELSPAETRFLSIAAAYLLKHPSDRLVLAAHCDTSGTFPYNAGLAVRRAKNVHKHLTALGVADEKIVYVIYGKNGPNPTRRVDVWKTAAANDAIAKYTFSQGGIAVIWH